jgi:hypothetical protein
MFQRMGSFACDHCGKHDSLVNLRTCICFEYNFCSEEHFQLHDHSKVRDEIHGQYTIGPNIRRLFRKAKFEPALTQFKKDFIDWLWRVDKDQAETMRDNSFELFKKQFSTSKREDVGKQLQLVVNTLQKVSKIENGEEAGKQLYYGSEELLRIWKSENLFSIRQKSKAIENAWARYLIVLWQFARNLVDEDAIDTIIPRVARILGGGKDEPM